MNAIDISPFLEAKSDQITADDLIAGPRSFRVERVEAPGGEQPVLIHMEGHEGRPFKPCKGMRRLLAQLWGPDAAKWIGRSVTLFRDPDVRFGADQTGGVRVAAVSHIEESRKVPVRVSRGKAKTYEVEPLRGAAAEPTVDKAAQWADDQVRAVAACADADALDALTSKGAKAMGKLQSDRPELHSRILEAYETKRATFAPPAADDDPFGSDDFDPGTGEIAE